MRTSRIVALALFAASVLVACAPPGVSSVSESGDELSEDSDGTAPKKITKKAKPKDGDEATTPSSLGGGNKRVGYASHAEPKSRHTYGGVAGPKGATKQSAIRIKSNGGELPPSVDLSNIAPPAGDQGTTQSCVSWATGYSVMGWWANAIGLQGAPFAPMFLYAPIVKGDCQTPTSVEDNLDLLKNYGIPSGASYQPMQQRLDCGTQPSRTAVDNAGQHRVREYQYVDTQSSASVGIAQTLAAGFPVIVLMQVFNALENVSSDNFLIDAPQRNESTQGGHAVAAFAYDQNGVWFLNSWTQGWGSNGWAQLSWDFIDGATTAGPNIMNAMVVTDVEGWQH